MKRVVVFGATGFVGRALLPRLGGHEVVAVSRTAPAARRRGRPVGRRRRHRPGAVAAALEGADAAYYLVHSLGVARLRGARPRGRAETVAKEAERAGAAADRLPRRARDDDADLSEHLRSRRDTAEALQRGAVPVTTLRAAMVVGAGSAAFETILALVDRLPGMVMPRWVSTKTQPIALADITRYLAGVLGREEALGQRVRRRRAGGHDLPRDDRAHRRAARQASAARRGAGADAAALVATGSTSSRP